MSKILKCLPEHMQAVEAIEKECITPPWSGESLRREAEACDGYFVVAAENDVPVGFAIAHRTGDEWELYQIAVTEQFRRRGIGSELLSAVLKVSAGSSVYLEVRKSNDNAIGLYKKYGFVELGVRKNYYSAPVEDALILRRGTGNDYTIG